jgi:hypothetical protein
MPAASDFPSIREIWLHSRHWPRVLSKSSEAVLHRIEDDVEHAADFFPDLFQADALFFRRLNSLIGKVCNCRRIVGEGRSADAPPSIFLRSRFRASSLKEPKGDQNEGDKKQRRGRYQCPLAHLPPWLRVGYKCLTVRQFVHAR